MEIEQKKEKKWKNMSWATFWAALPVIYAIVYFVVNSFYKIEMQNRYKIPLEYFKLDLTRFIVIFSFSIIVPLSSLLCIHSSVDIKREKISITRKIRKHSINFFCFKIKFLYICKMKEKYNYIRCFFGIAKMLWILSLSFYMLLCEIIIALNLSIPLPFYPFLKYQTTSSFEVIILYCLIFLLDIFFLSGFVFKKEILKLKSKITIKMFTLFMAIGGYIYISSVIAYMFDEKKEYEIVSLKDDSKPKAIISTYDGKYIIADCHIDEKANNNENQLEIFTKKYQIVKMNEVQEVEYRKFKTIMIRTDSKI